MRQDEERGEPVRLYERDLPGGGYVAVEVVAERVGDREVPVTRVSVERRQVTDRRHGHAPPVIATAEGDEASGAFLTLFEMARDNAAVARGILAWERRQRRPEMAV